LFYIGKGLIKTTKITLYTYVFYLWERYEENNLQTITSSILYKYITIGKSGRLWETFYIFLHRGK